MPLSSILAPVDFSADSAGGASLARDIARRHDARLVLLHVDGLPVYSEHVARAASAEGWLEHLGQRDAFLNAELRRFAARLHCPESTEFVVVRGDASKAIQEHARQNSCELLVIAPRGAGYGQRFLLGSVSAEVAAHASCPVLVARTRDGKPPSTGAFTAPVVAVSNPQLAEHALTLTMALSEPASEIHLLHVLESFEVSVGPPRPGAFHAAVEQRRQQLCAQLAELAEPAGRMGFTTAIRVETGDPSFCLLNRIETGSTDLVVVSRKLRTRGAVGLSTPAYRLVKHSPVPVLVVPSRAPGH